MCVCVFGFCVCFCISAVKRTKFPHRGGMMKKVSHREDVLAGAGPENFLLGGTTINLGTKIKAATDRPL